MSTLRLSVPATNFKPGTLVIDKKKYIVQVPRFQRNNRWSDKNIRKLMMDLSKGTAYMAPILFERHGDVLVLIDGGHRLRCVLALETIPKDLTIGVDIHSGFKTEEEDLKLFSTVNSGVRVTQADKIMGELAIHNKQTYMDLVKCREKLLKVVRQDITRKDNAANNMTIRIYKLCGTDIKRTIAYIDKIAENLKGMPETYRTNKGFAWALMVHNKHKHNPHVFDIMNNTGSGEMVSWCDAFPKEFLDTTIKLKKGVLSE